MTEYKSVVDDGIFIDVFPIASIANAPKKSKMLCRLKKIFDPKADFERFFEKRFRPVDNTMLSNNKITVISYPQN